jgi:myo-inositol-1(or 4)-monophosphatase
VTGQAAGPSPDPHRLLALAEAAAADAARMLAGRRAEGRPGVVATKSSPTDVVTEADRAAEAMIIERILAERPGDAFLGEEGGQRDGTRGPPRRPGQPGGVRWIVDPLDGTVNYLYGLPDFAVSIAAEADGEIVAGVVHLPERGEVFTAVAGSGAWLLTAGRPAVALRCNRDVPLSRALVATGFGYEVGRRKVQGEVAGALLPLVRDIRRGGSAAIDLCSVAAGRVDAYYERGVNYWDIAAGGLIAAEAGARVGGLSGQAAGSGMTIAADPPLFAELNDVLSRLKPLRDG